jgi:hypothetical protein
MLITHLDHHDHRVQAQHITLLQLINAIGCVLVGVDPPAGGSQVVHTRPISTNDMVLSGI